jgi:esterase/lipase superfamily enzyme
MRRSTLIFSTVLFILPGCVADYGETADTTRDVPSGMRTTVLYATDRQAAATGYGDGRTDITYGVADYLVSPSHVVGGANASSVASAGSAADIEVVSTTPLPAGDFSTNLHDALGSATRREILLYVHGYNSDFQWSMRRTAQIAHDLDYDGVAMAFAWPSAGSVASYLADLNNADWAASDLAETLRMLIRDSGADRIDLIAHSMGSRLLIQALDDLARGRPATDPPLFGDVIFAAPDVDSEIFSSAIERLQPLAERFTLYVSANDFALATSRKLAGDHPRAGESGKGMVVIAGLDTVDTSAVGDDLFGHEYLGDSAPVLDDIRTLLRDHAGAADRPGLQRDFYLGRSYWRLEAPPALPAS